MPNSFLETFLATVDPSKSTVVSFPDFVAVFGGEISKNVKRKYPASQRDAFVRWVKKNKPDISAKLILPENYDDWNDFDVYEDLLLFEKDLGCLTSAVVIFLEAPGAIAELGAFSQIPILSQRLVVVVTQNRHPKKSFISLGPIRSISITQKHLYSVCTIPSAEKKTLDDHMPVVMETVDQKRKPASATTKFSNTEPQHEILLVLDTINLLLVANQTEIQEIASHFSVNLDRKRLHQILFVLEKTNLIKKLSYGSNEFYLPTTAIDECINHTSLEGAPSFIRTRAKTIRLGELNSDRHRKYLISKNIKGGKK